MTTALPPALPSDGQPFEPQIPIPPFPELHQTDWSTISYDRPVGFQYLPDSPTNTATLIGPSATDTYHSEADFLPDPSGPEDSTALFNTIYGPSSIDNCHQFSWTAADGEERSLQETVILAGRHAFFGMAETTQGTTESGSQDNLFRLNRTSSSTPNATMAWPTPDPSGPSSLTPTSTGAISPPLPRGVQNDVRSLDMPMLKVLRAGKKIADILNCTSQMWDPFFQHVVQDQYPGMPPHFKATKAQQRILHHPIIDIIPWASARTKLICIFSQPAELRPPSARDPLAIMLMIADMDDEAEGLRIWGDDGWDSKNWEVGEAFFRHWWWALDREIVENSNRLRALRGASKLRITES